MPYILDDRIALAVTQAIVAGASASFPSTHVGAATKGVREAEIHGLISGLSYRVVQSEGAPSPAGSDFAPLTRDTVTLPDGWFLDLRNDTGGTLNVAVVYKRDADLPSVG